MTTDETLPCRINPAPRRSLGETRDPKLLVGDDWFIDQYAGRDTEDGKRRRRAKQACWTDCPMAARLLCLHEGLKDENVEHGIWGGYGELDRQAINSAIEERELHQGRFLQILADPDSNTLESTLPHSPTPTR